MATLATETDPASLLHRIEQAHVHVVVEVEAPSDADTVRVLIRNLRQLPVQLSIGGTPADSSAAGELVDELSELCTAIDPDRPLRSDGIPPDGAIVVHVGVNATATVLAAAIPDGHGARLRAGGDEFPTSRQPPTGLGSVLAAALLTAEVFKAVTGLAESRPTSLDFCPVQLNDQPGVEHDPVILLDRVALLGCGAIGTAIALILSYLEATGRLTVVDPEAFEDPNIITYSLGVPGDVGVKKVQLTRDALSDIAVTPLDMDIETYIARIDERLSTMPSIVLNGLDTIPARHDSRRIRADLTLDGSTGGTAGTTVGLRVATPDGPCLRCFYPLRTGGQTLTDLTGIPGELLRNGADPVTDELIASAAPELREKIRQHRGERICALARLLNLDGQLEDYRPSASFVAQLAACLVVGSLIATLQGVERDDVREVEYDALYGWNEDAAQGRRPTSTCECQVDRDLIAEVRRRRGAGSRT